MKSYIDYFELGGRFLYRLLPFQPKDKNGEKKEILNNVDAGYLPGMFWRLFNRNANEIAISENNKNVTTTNSNRGSKYEFNIPSSIADTVITVPNRNLAIRVINKPLP